MTTTYSCNFEENIATEHQNLLDSLEQQINDYKQKTIYNKLKELNISIDIQEEENRRFKRFILEKRGNIETVYYNDGTINGLALCSFQTLIETDKLCQNVTIEEIKIKKRENKLIEKIRCKMK